MRFVGKSRLGFYPLPLSEAQRIRRFHRFPDVLSPAIDPCVGDNPAPDRLSAMTARGRLQPKRFPERSRLAADFTG